MHTGRSRYRTHGGIPHGSTNNLGSNLGFYFQNNIGVAAGEWADQSSNGRHAVQETEGDQADVAEGGLDFEEGEGDHYDLASQVAIASQEGFTVFIVCKLENANNMTIISSNNNTNLLEFTNTENTMKVRLGGSTTTVTPSTTGDFAVGSKMLVVVQREAGGTGNINLYKNGVILGQSSQATNTGDGTFVALGVKNANRFFDGIMHDVAMIEGGVDTAAVRDRISGYLMGKHGIN
jgi:hypothetical protein